MDNFIKSFYSITKMDLFDFVTRIYMNKGYTKEQAYEEIYKLAIKLKKARKLEKLEKEKIMKPQHLILYIIAIVLLITLLSSCTPSPYWAIKHHDGIEQRTYMKRAWPIDQTCRTYAGNNPIQHKTWANQFYWKRKY